MDQVSEAHASSDSRDASPSTLPSGAGSSTTVNGYAYSAALGGLRMARRIAVGVIGSTVVAIGVAMIVLPGPAFVVIPAGLGILGLEFAFARRWLKRLRERAADVAAKVSASVTSSAPARDDERDEKPADD